MTTKARLTTGLLALRGSTLANGTGLLQVDVPALLLAGLVLQGESEDGTTLLDGGLLVGIAGDGRGDGIESLRRREVGWSCTSAFHPSLRYALLEQVLRVLSRATHRS